MFQLGRPPCENPLHSPGPNIVPMSRGARGAGVETALSGLWDGRDGSHPSTTENHWFGSRKQMTPSYFVGISKESKVSVVDFPKKTIHWEDPSDGWPIVRVIFRTYQVGSSSKYYCLVVCPLKKYFASSDPHHDISKQLVDTTFVWSFCHGTFAQLTIPIICFTWQVIVHVSLSNRI